MLEAYRQRQPFDANLRRAAETLRFDGVPLPAGDQDVVHFQVVLNPYDLDGGTYVTTMYKRPYRTDYPQPEPSAGRLGPGDDALGFVGLITDGVPALIPALVNGLFGNVYASYERWGTLGEIFTNTDIRGKSASTAMAVPLDQGNTALDIFFAVHDEYGPFAGVVALRYVKGTQATLGFTRFDPSCVIEIDGVYSTRTTQFFRQVWNAFEEQGMPYTFHWGKMHNLTTARVRRMYGTAVDDWVQRREELLDEPTRKVFTNNLMTRMGLAS